MKNINQMILDSVADTLTSKEFNKSDAQVPPLWEKYTPTVSQIEKGRKNDKKAMESMFDLLASKEFNPKIDTSYLNAPAKIKTGIAPETMQGQSWKESMAAFQEMQLTNPQSKEFAEAQLDGAKGIERIGAASKKNYGPMLSQYNQMGKVTKRVANGFLDLSKAGVKVEKNARPFFELGRNLGFSGFVLNITFQRINATITNTVTSLLNMTKALGSVDASFGWLEDTMSALALADAGDEWFEAGIQGWEDYFEASRKLEGEIAKLKVILQPFINILIDVASKGLAEIVNTIVKVGSEIDVLTGKSKFESWLSSMQEAAIILSKAVIEAFNMLFDFMRNPQDFHDAITGIAAFVGGYIKGIAASVREQINWLINIVRGKTVAFLDDMGYRMGYWFSILEKVGTALTVIGSPLQTLGMGFQNLGNAMVLVSEIGFAKFIAGAFLGKASLASLETGFTGVIAQTSMWTQMFGPMQAGIMTTTGLMTNLRTAILGVTMAGWAMLGLGLVMAANWIKDNAVKTVQDQNPNMNAYNYPNPNPEGLNANKTLTKFVSKEDTAAWLKENSGAVDAPGARNSISISPTATSLRDQLIKAKADELAWLKTMDDLKKDPAYMKMDAEAKALQDAQWAKDYPAPTQPNFSSTLTSPSAYTGPLGIFGGPKGSLINGGKATVPSAPNLTDSTPSSPTTFTDITKEVKEAIVKGFEGVQLSQYNNNTNNWDIQNLTADEAGIERIVIKVLRAENDKTARLGVKSLGPR